MYERISRQVPGILAMLAWRLASFFSAVGGAILALVLVTGRLPLVLPVSMEEVPAGQCFVALLAVIAAVFVIPGEGVPLALVAPVSAMLAFSLAVLPTAACAESVLGLGLAAMLMMACALLRHYRKWLAKNLDGAPAFVAALVALCGSVFLVVCLAVTSFAGRAPELLEPMSKPVEIMAEGLDAWGPRPSPRERRRRMETLCALAASEAAELGMSLEVRSAVLPEGEVARLVGDRTVLVSVGCTSANGPWESVYQVSHAVFLAAERDLLAGEGITLPARASGAWKTMSWGEDSASAESDARAYAQQMVDQVRLQAGT